MKYEIQEAMTLFEALLKLSPQSSKNTLKAWLEGGRITVDGAIEKKMDLLLQAGQNVCLESKTRLLEGNIKLLYEDGDLLIVEKPAGLLSVATDFQTVNTAHAILKRTYRKRLVHVVHRLDQETSGVMVFALGEKSKEALKKMFEKHDLVREYIAIVEGHLEEAEGSWTSYLYEQPNYKVYVTNDTEKGKIAITHYLVEAVSRRYSRLKLKLETGRKNQIRVQSQEAGHPVVGDSKYGAKTNPIKRLALHAHRLEFIHPFTKARLVFTSPPPESFKRLVN